MISNLKRQTELSGCFAPLLTQHQCLPFLDRSREALRGTLVKWLRRGCLASNVKQGMGVMAGLAVLTGDGLRTTCGMTLQAQAGDCRPARNGIGFHIVAFVEHVAAAFAVTSRTGSACCRVFRQIPLEDGIHVTTRTDTGSTKGGRRIGLSG